jgi:hypothetical protein
VADKKCKILKSLTPNPSPIERGANRFFSKKIIREFVAKL